MIRVSIPKSMVGANILTASTHAGKSSQVGVISLGTGPVMIDGDSFSIRANHHFDDTGLAIDNENSIEHWHTDGDLVVVEDSLVTFKKSGYHPTNKFFGTYHMQDINGWTHCIGGALCGVGRKTWTSDLYDAKYEAFVSRRKNRFGAFYMSQRRAPNQGGHCNGTVGMRIFHFGNNKSYARTMQFSIWKDESVGAFRKRLMEELEHLFTLPLNSKVWGTEPIRELVPSTLRKEEVHEAIAYRSFQFKYPREFTPRGEIGSLVRKAVEGMDVIDYNMIDFAVKAKNIMSLLPPVDDLKDVLKGKAKAFANVYLWIRYGLTLTSSNMMSLTSDIPVLLEQAKKLDEVVRIAARSHGTVPDDTGDWDVAYVFSAFVDQYPHQYGHIGRQLSLLYSWDIMPTSQNLWDMIPYSFVLDWVYPVSNILNNFDFNTKVELYKVHAAVQSYRLTREQDNPTITGMFHFGQLTDVIYHRYVTPSLPMLGVFEENTVSKFGLRRIIDATALTIQRLG